MVCLEDEVDVKFIGCVCIMWDWIFEVDFLIDLFIGEGKD